MYLTAILSHSQFTVLSVIFFLGDFSFTAQLEIVNEFPISTLKHNIALKIMLLAITCIAYNTSPQGRAS